MKVVLQQSKRPVQYRERILDYCNREGIVVPKGFDAPKSSERYAAIEITQHSPMLYKYTTYSKKAVVVFLTAPENSGRNFKVLDFKSCCEIIFDGSQLKKGASFDCFCQEELRQIALLQEWDAQQVAAKKIAYLPD
jgi:hypothetical protein